MQALLKSAVKGSKNTYRVLGGTIKVLGQGGQAIVSNLTGTALKKVGDVVEWSGASIELVQHLDGSVGIVVKTSPNGLQVVASTLLENSQNAILRMQQAKDEILLVVRKSVVSLDELWRLYPHLKALFDDLPTTARTNLEKLSPNTLKATLTKLESNAELLTALKQKPELSRLWTAHKGSFTAVEIAEAENSFATLAEELSENARKLAEDLAEESGKKQRMIEIFGLGNSLSANIKTALRTQNGTLFNNLASQLGMTPEQLKLYEILDEIPLNTTNGFMKADVMLIKRNSFDAKIIDDAIIIENKLSAGTAFTIRQKEGFGTIINGQTSMNVNYTKDGITPTMNIPVSNQKIFKMYDHGTDDISKVSIQKITSTN